MSRLVDVAIIGSGPAGVSAAWPLVETGLQVAMLDQGNLPEAQVPPETTFLEMRHDDPEQWRRLIGEDFFALKATGTVSPKLKVPASRFVFGGFTDAYKIAARNFLAVGSLAAGGLSNVWGAGSYAYDDRDFGGGPVTRGDFEESYRTVAARIGLSGVDDDDLGAFYGADMPLQPPLALDVGTADLLSRYERLRDWSRNRGVRLGRGRNAVLSQDKDGGGACSLCDMCLWGCSRGSIYNAADDLGRLRKKKGFAYQPQAFVRSVRRDGDGFLLAYGSVDDPSVRSELKARRVVFAAGTIGSTRLALDFLSADGGGPVSSVTLLSNPAVAIAFIMPRHLGRALPERNFSMGQLGYVVEDRDDDTLYSHGAIIVPSAVLGSELARYLPFSRPAAMRAVRCLAPALIVANCYLPGEYSRNSLRIEGRGGSQGVAIDGGYAETVDDKARDVRQRLGQVFRRLGAFALPGVHLTQPGADVHYAGTLPMREAPERSGAPATDRFGGLCGAGGAYIVDGAVLPRLPAKNPTFTIMANADRIGRHIARSFRE